MDSNSGTGNFVLGQAALLSSGPLEQSSLYGKKPFFAIVRVPEVVAARREEEGGGAMFRPAGLFCQTAPCRDPPQLRAS